MFGTKTQLEAFAKALNGWDQVFRDHFDQTGQPFNDATKYGISVKQAQAQPGHLKWQVKGVHLLTGAENQGNSHIFVNAYLENGQRATEYVGNAKWEGGDWKPVPFEKAPPEPLGNFFMTIQMVGVQFRVQDSIPVDTVMGMLTNITPDIDPPGTTRGHVSYYIMTELMVAGNTSPGPEPGPDLPVITAQNKGTILTFNRAELKAVVDSDQSETVDILISTT